MTEAEAIMQSTAISNIVTLIATLVAGILIILSLRSNFGCLEKILSIFVIILIIAGIAVAIIGFNSSRVVTPESPDEPTPISEQSTEHTLPVSTQEVTLVYTDQLTATVQTSPTETPSSTATPSPTEVISYFVLDYITENRGWRNQNVIRTFGTTATNPGADMVLVPRGCLTSGRCFDTPFWVDRFEVTNMQFNRFGGESISQDPPDMFPKEYVTPEEAVAYCDKRGGRLPTQEEWEYVAYGPDNLPYPWGMEFLPEHVVTNQAGTSPVGIGLRDDGVSWVGAYDLIGNVAEIVSTPGDSYLYIGGSYMDESRQAQQIATLTTRYTNVGFRCVRNYIEGDLDEYPAPTPTPSP